MKELREEVQYEIRLIRDDIDSAFRNVAQNMAKRAQSVTRHDSHTGSSSDNVQAPSLPATAYDTISSPDAPPPVVASSTPRVPPLQLPLPSGADSVAVKSPPRSQPRSPPPAYKAPPLSYEGYQCQVKALPAATVKAPPQQVGQLPPPPELPVKPPPPSAPAYYKQTPTTAPAANHAAAAAATTAAAAAETTAAAATTRQAPKKHPWASQNPFLGKVYTNHDWCRCQKICSGGPQGSTAIVVH